MPATAQIRNDHLSRRADPWFNGLTLAAALLVLLTLLGVFVSLLMGAWPALKSFGFSFFTSTAWNPVKDEYGALPAIRGTLVTSAIAMFIAVPLGIGIAIFLTDLCPRWLQRPVALAVELLAGIPSIIYGIWGLFVFAPFVQSHVQPWLNQTFAGFPGLNRLLTGPPYGIGLLTAGIILSMMVLPFIAALARDIFLTVPPVLREAAYGIGLTKWEVNRHIVLPHSRTALTGGIMLALGRALGETMAVTFVVGNSHRITASIVAPGTTISASIANEFNEATTHLYTSSLIALGLVLFFITFVVLSLAQLMLAHMRKRAGE